MAYWAYVKNTLQVCSLQGVKVCVARLIRRGCGRYGRLPRAAARG